MEKTCVWCWVRGVWNWVCDAYKYFGRGRGAHALALVFTFTILTCNFSSLGATVFDALPVMSRAYLMPALHPRSPVVKLSIRFLKHQEERAPIHWLRIGGILPTYTLRSDGCIRYFDVPRKTGESHKVQHRDSVLKFVRRVTGTFLRKEGKLKRSGGKMYMEGGSEIWFLGIVYLNALGGWWDAHARGIRLLIRFIIVWTLWGIGRLVSEGSVVRVTRVYAGEDA